MKTKQRSFKKAFAFFLPVFIIALAFASCNKDDDNPVNNNPYSISGNATGAQVVPSVSATGTGTISGNYNPANGAFIYTAHWDSLTAAPVNGGLYNAAAGANGSRVDSSWTFESASGATGSITDTLTLTADQATQLLNGNWYYTLGTTANPSGEIRGQISATR